MNRFWLILGQSLRLSFRKGGGAFGTCAFYVIIVTFLTFALGPAITRQHAGAILCAALFLANILALPYLYERDFEDGTLEQLLLQPMLMELLALAKLCGQWLSIVLPIIVASPLLAVMAGLQPMAAGKLVGLLLLVSPSMLAIGSVTALLTLGEKRGGMLQALIALPLTVPLLIFASSAEAGGAILFLCGMACASVPLSCLLSAALVRMALN